MKILLYNPNTTVSITEKLYETAKLVVSGETILVPKTADKGFPYISTKVEAQITGTLVLEKIFTIFERSPQILYRCKIADSAANTNGNVKLAHQFSIVF